MKIFESCGAPGWIKIATGVADSSDAGGEAGLPDVNSSDALVDPIIGVIVNYEYQNYNINPEITVTNYSNAQIVFTKNYDHSFKGYRLNFSYPGVINGTQFNVMVKAPGYVTQTQNVLV